MAQDNYPLTKEAALARGYKWQSKKYSINIPENMTTIQGKDLPITIGEVGDDILQKVILCEETGKPFRIIQQELDFYRKHNIPLPTRHQDVRTATLRKKRLPLGFHIINCTHCQQEVLSAYPADSGYNIWCEKCYTQKFYG